jgi:hypothetical protein
MQISPILGIQYIISIFWTSTPKRLTLRSKWVALLLPLWRSWFQISAQKLGIIVESLRGLLSISKILMAFTSNYILWPYATWPAESIVKRNIRKHTKLCFQLEHHGCVLQLPLSALTQPSALVLFPHCISVLCFLIRTHTHTHTLINRVITQTVWIRVTDRLATSYTHCWTKALRLLLMLFKQITGIQMNCHCFSALC